MSPRTASTRGYTLIETAMTVAIFGLLIAGFGRTLVTSSALSAQSRGALMAGDDERRSLDAITSQLRDARYLSISGFDPASGIATSLTYQRALGVNPDGTLRLDTPETMAWRPGTRPYDGVTNPGEVAITKDGTSTVVAPRVAQNGFTCTLVGNTLRVSLTTFSATSQRKVSYCACTNYVSVRN